MAFWKVTATWVDDLQLTEGEHRIPEFFVEVEQGHLFGVASAREKAFAVLTAQGINGTVQFQVHEPDSGRQWAAFIRLLDGGVMQLQVGITPKAWISDVV